MGRTSEYRIKDSEPFGACPMCGKGLYVIDSRTSPRGYIRRRRSCSGHDCNYRLSTAEITKEEYERLKHMAETLPMKLAEAVDAIHQAAEAIK